MENMREHWEKTYSSNPTQKLGWFETHSEKSLEMIEHCGLAPNAKIVDIGSGASTLIDDLLSLGYTAVTAVDISAKALQATRERLGKKLSKKVTWLIDDLTRPVHLAKIKNVELWHDRAVLHFLLEDKQRQAYRDTLCKIIKPGGQVIIAAFAVGGATHCSGLNIHNYDRESLIDFLGSDFQIRESFNHVYHMPSGNERLYIYARFTKKQALPGESPMSQNS